MLLYLKKKKYIIMKSFSQTYTNLVFLLKVKVALRKADQVQPRSRCFFFESLQIYLSHPFNYHSGTILIADTLTRV